MKKSDLRATLGAVRSNEAQIARVMETVAARKQKEEIRVPMTRFNFGLRLATAACAFLLVVGLGVAAFSNDLFLAPDAIEYGVQRANEDIADNNTETDNNSHDDADESALTVLLLESEQIDGDYAVVTGVANAFYFVGGEVEEGEHRCVISVSVEEVHKTSAGVVIGEDEIVADVSFLNDGELERFTDSISSSIALLIEKNDTDHDTEWTVRKISY